MSRFALALALVVAAACNPPEAKDHEAIWTDLKTDDGGDVAGAAFVFTATADPDARALDSTIRVTLGGLFEENTHLDMALVVMEGFSEVGSEKFTTPGENAEVAYAVDFEACDGVSYEETSDGGCAYTGAALVVGDRPYSVLVGFDLRTQAPKDWEGDKDALDVRISAEELTAR